MQLTIQSRKTLFAAGIAVFAAGIAVFAVVVVSLNLEPDPRYIPATGSYQTVSTIANVLHCEDLSPVNAPNAMEAGVCDHGQLSIAVYPTVEQRELALERMRGIERFGFEPPETVSFDRWIVTCGLSPRFNCDYVHKALGGDRI